MFVFFLLLIYMFQKNKFLKYKYTNKKKQYQTATKFHYGFVQQEGSNVDFYFHRREEFCILDPPIGNQNPLSDKNQFIVSLFCEENVSHKITKQYGCKKEKQKFFSLYHKILSHKHTLFFFFLCRKKEVNIIKQEKKQKNKTTNGPRSK